LVYPSAGPQIGDPKIMAHNKGKYGLAAAYCAANLNNHLRARFIMAANTADVALLLVKKLGGVVLILFGVIGIAIGLEYRTTGLSAGWQWDFKSACHAAVLAAMG
jgi:hypothetical protein